jgi:hypothetical protein
MPLNFRMASFSEELGREKKIKNKNPKAQLYSMKKLY